MTDEVPDFGLDGFQNPSDDEGLSLDELSQAYVNLIQQGTDPYEAPQETPTEEVADDEPDEVVEVEEPVQSAKQDVSPAGIVEAMLFVGTPDNSPLATKKIASLMRGVREQEVVELVDELNERYDEDATPYKIVSTGPGFQMVLRDEYMGLRNTFYGKIKDAKLSQTAIDVLAIVAYNQPITRNEVDELRGQGSSGLLNQLVRRQLLLIERPKEKPRIAKYSTTPRFLQLFHLESLDDLPRSQDLDRAGS